MWTNTYDWGRNGPVSLLGYGSTGVGKTRLIATLPKPVIIASERGVLSLREFNIPTALVDNFKSFDKAVSDIFATGQQFETICVDSLSEIAELCLAEEKHKNKDPRKAYGEMQDQVNALIRRLVHNGKYNVYMTAKQDKLQLPDGSIMNGPLLPGKTIQQATPYHFDEVVQVFVRKDPATQRIDRWLRCHADNLNDAKDRSGRLSEYEPPDLGQLFAKIRGQI
jgi:hypothetical protein